MTLTDCKLLFVKNSIFKNSVSLEKGTFKIVETTAIIQDCIFISIFAKFGTIIYADKIKSFIFFKNNQIINCTNKFGTLMLLNKVEKLYLYNNTFENSSQIFINAKSSSIFLLKSTILNFNNNQKNLVGLMNLIESRVIIISCSIKNLINAAFMPLIFGKKSILVIQYTEFKNLNSTDYPINFWLLSTKLMIANTKIFFYNKGLFYLNGCNFTIFNSLIINDKSSNKITSYEDIFVPFYILRSACAVISTYFQKNKNEFQGAGVLN